MNQREQTQEHLGRWASKSPVHRATQVRDRVQALLPGAQVEIVANASHALTISDPELAAARITAFVDRVAS